MFSQARGGTVPFSWLAYCFGGAILSHIIADRIARMSWGGRIRDLLDAIPEYRALLEAYPEAEILTREPSALSTADG